MTASPWSAKETLRLAKLRAYDILDTPPEPAYDDIVALAAQICQAPAALISLIDANRQWFKAKVGFDVTQTPRGMAFCSHTIEQDEPLIVWDTHQSAQFCQHPLVTGPPYIRFYAGVPLATPDGHALGSLCVIDYQPRQLDAQQVQALEILARQVVAQMELTRYSQQMDQAHAQLEAKVQARTAGLAAALQRVLKTQSRLVQREVAARQQGLQDPLTGLPNRSYFLQRLHQAIQLHHRQPSHVYAVLVIDLGDLTPVHEVFGHDAGDRLLQHVARQILNRLRKSDLVARLRGDAFAVLLDDLPDEDHAIVAVKRLQAALRSPLILDRQSDDRQSDELRSKDRKLYAQVSMGLTLSKIGYRLPEAALRDAEIAMSHAKKLSHQRAQAALKKQKHQNRVLTSPLWVQDEVPLNGRQFAVFEPRMHAPAPARRTLEDELRQALTADQFQLGYQPIFNLKTQALTGFEVLLRWAHPHRGYVAAQDFIAIAEELGIVRQLRAQIWHTACQQLKAWQAFDPTLTLHLNLSLLQMRNAHLVSQWRGLLTRYQLSPQDFQIEIGESVLLSDDPVIQSVLQDIKIAGFGLCVDDFGLGHSALQRLHQHPVRTLKIDRAFVQGRYEQTRPHDKRLHDQRPHDMSQTIVDLGRSAGMAVIATGIETPAQLQALLSIGCGFGQGFWLSAPLTADAVTAQLKASAR